MKKLCTICMRGGSKGVPNKNIKKMHGKPLLAYTINHALQSKLFDHLVVSTDSIEIAEIAKSYGADCWFVRPKKLATDKSPKIPVIRHALLEAEKYYGYNFEIVVDLDSTSPLREVKDINNAYEKFTNDNADNLITGSPARKNPYFNMVEIIDNHIKIVKNSKKNTLRRQDAPKVYDMNASFYIWKREVLIKSDTLFNSKTSLFVMPEERSIDIDNTLDWKLVKTLMNK